MSRSRRAAERVAVRQPSCPSPDLASRVSFDELIDDLIGTAAEELELVVGERVGDGDKPVPVEEFGCTLDIGRFDDFQFVNAVLFSHPLSERNDFRVIECARPRGAAWISGDEIAMLRSGFDIDLAHGRRNTDLVVVRADVFSQRAVVKAVRRHVRIQTDHVFRPVRSPLTATVSQATT